MIRCDYHKDGCTKEALYELESVHVYTKTDGLHGVMPKALPHVCMTHKYDAEKLIDPVVRGMRPLYKDADIEIYWKLIV